jgi:thiopurine S-methyltransferase
MTEDIKVDTGFWLNRWQTGDTGWHQGEVEEQLIKHFSDLKPTRVVVPLCGKSLDLAWLASRGHEVLGAELSELAVHSFYEEHRISPRVSKQGDFNVFSGGGITIFQGDVFKLTQAVAGNIGAIYDRAALIALPREMRAPYARKLIELSRGAGPVFRMLQLVIERTPTDEEGPPFSVTESEVRELYSKEFDIRFLESEAIDAHPRWPDRSVQQRVYLFKAR